MIISYCAVIVMVMLSTTALVYAIFILKKGQ